MSSASPDVTARIAGLYVYPVKSCAGISLSEAELLDTGLDLDRAWMVVDTDGEFLSQRELPRMALITPRLRHGDLMLRAPGMLALHLALDAVEAPLRVRVWDDVIQAYDMGPVAAQWFSDFLGRPVRLARFDPEQRRLSNLKWTAGLEAPNQFSDGFPLLVTSQASLDELNARLAAAGQPAVGMERFRPNLVIDGVLAHDEDRLPQLRVDTGAGEVVLNLVKPCARCQIPDIDPASAESGHAVGDVLQAYRSDARLDGAITFGMNAIVSSGTSALLRIGLPVYGDYAFD